MGRGVREDTFESCMGVSNTDLAKKYNLTPQHISNILNTEQARHIKDNM
jgi:Mor family transcriptional regulator